MGQVSPSFHSGIWMPIDQVSVHVEFKLNLLLKSIFFLLSGMLSMVLCILLESIEQSSISSEPVADTGELFAGYGI
jgi:hypothetical protein